MQVGADLLVLRRIEAVRREELAKASAGSGAIGRGGGGTIEQAGEDRAVFGTGARGGGELADVVAFARRAIRFGPAQGGREGSLVETSGQERGVAGQERGSRAVLIDREVVDDRIHREGQGGLELALGLEHHALQELLSVAL